MVDPGVGSSRKPILVCADDYYFIGPDNGIFSLVYKLSSEYKIFELNNSKYFLDDVSATFHGRDIFSSVAAYLSTGIDPFEFGTLLTDPVKFDFVEYFEDDKCIRGEIIYCDKFGNLVSNIPSDKVRKDSVIKIGNKIIDNVSCSYSSVVKGEVLAIIGSSGLLEISVNQGSAKDIISNKEIKIIKN